MFTDITRPNCTRLKTCSICPFKDSDFDRNETDQDDYHRMAMLDMASEGESVWTCLYHLTKDKTLHAQCHVGAKELIKAKQYLQQMEGK